MKVAYSRTSKENLDNVPYEDGQIIVIKDTYELYMDLTSGRTKVSDIIFVATSEDRISITNPIQEKLYFVLEESSLYRYDGTEWVSLSSANSIKFDNTDTDLVSDTVQAAIKELNSKIGNINQILDKINGENI